MFFYNSAFSVLYMSNSAAAWNCFYRIKSGFKRPNWFAWPVFIVGLYEFIQMYTPLFNKLLIRPICRHNHSLFKAMPLPCWEKVEVIWSKEVKSLLNLSLVDRWGVLSEEWLNKTESHLYTSLEMKWNESGFRPPLCTYRLNWARRTSWGWWDDWDDTVLQTQDSKLEPWRSEAEHATSRSRRLPTILTFTRGWGRNNFVSFKPPRPGTEPRTLAWKAAVLTTTLGPPPIQVLRKPSN